MCACGANVPCINAHARWSYSGRYKPLFLCPLSVELYLNSFCLLHPMWNRSKEKAAKTSLQSFIHYAALRSISRGFWRLSRYNNNRRSVYNFCVIYPADAMSWWLRWFSCYHWVSCTERDWPIDFKMCHKKKSDSQSKEAHRYTC